MKSRQTLIDVSLSWLFALVILPLVLLILVQLVGLDLLMMPDVRVWWQLILEFIFVGFVPLLIVILRREDRRLYGFTTVNWRRSLLLGLFVATPFLAFKLYAYLYQGYAGWSWSLPTPMLLLYLPVYGPLEAFFIVFSVVKLDQVLPSGRLISRGLILTALLFGAMHTVNYLFNPDWQIILAGYVLGNIVPGIFVGFIFKRDRSILGPALFWTTLNFF